MKPLFTAERRACMVRSLGGEGLKEERAFFHLFTTRAHPIEPSPLRGGHPGGQISAPVAIVEYEDGTVHAVDPVRVRFLDTKELMERHGRDEEPERRCRTCRHEAKNMGAEPCVFCDDENDRWEPKG